MTSTRSAPRMGQGAASMTSLGAVGGPMGVSAGATRVLVEFLTSYDPAGAKKAEADLARMQANANRAAQRESSRQLQLADVRQKISRTEATVASKLTSDQRKELNTIQALRETGTRRDTAEANKREKALINNLRSSGQFTRQQLSDLKKIGQYRQQELQLVAQSDRFQENQRQRGKALIQQEGKLTQLKGVGGKALSQLGGLTMGALSGMFGGALLGIGFEAAQLAIDKLVEGVQDIIDPARHSRDALLELGDAVAKIANSKGLSFFDAAGKYMEQLGLKADEATQRLLGQAAAQTQIKATLEALAKVMVGDQNPEVLYQDNLKATILYLKEKDRAEKGGEKTTQVTNWEVRGMATGYVTREVTDDAYYQAEAIKWLNDRIAELTGLAQQATWAEYALANAEARAAQAAALASIQQDLFNEALADASEAWLQQAQDQMDAAGGGGAGTDPRVKALQAQLDAIQELAEAEQYEEQLRNINEERELILLGERLKLLGTNIDLEQYSGKFLVAAINAKIAALNKEGEAQNRLNQLMDLQYRESQTQRRNEGESIQEFEERKARENAGFLKEHQDMAREAQIDELEQLKDKTQTEIDLEANAEAKKKLIADRARQLRIQALQKELAAIQSAASSGLTAQQKAIQQEIKDRQKKLETVKKLANDEQIAITTTAIWGMKSMAEIMEVEGRIQGYKIARETIMALGQGFGMPKESYMPMVEKIDALISLFEWRMNTMPVMGGNGLLYRQHGGLIPLNNGSTTFGSNVRVGEAGTELGIVLSNRVTEALRRQQPVMFGDINVQGSDDPYRDTYRLKKAVKEAVKEALS